MPPPLLLAAAIPAVLGAGKAIAGGIGVRKHKKALKGLKDPGAVSQGMADVVAAKAARAQGADPIMKTQMDALEAQRANELAQMREASTSSNQLLGAISSGTQAAGRQQSGIIAQAGMRKIGAQEAYEQARMGIEQKKQQRKMQQYDTAVSQAKQDIQRNKENIMGGLYDIGAAGMKALTMGGGGGGGAAAATSATSATPRQNIPSATDPNAVYAPSAND